MGDGFGGLENELELSFRQAASLLRISLRGFLLVVFMACFNLVICSKGVIFLAKLLVLSFFLKALFKNNAFGEPERYRPLFFWDLRFRGDSGGSW